MLRRIALLAGVLPLFACATPRTTAPDAFEVIPLEHAAASDVAKVLERAFSGYAGQHARVVADRRTNSLVVLATAEAAAQVKDLVVVLDREVN